MTLDRRWLVPLAAPVALVSMFAAQAGGSVMALTNAGTVAALALVLMAGGRRHDALRRTRVMLLCASRLLSSPA